MQILQDLPPKSGDFTYFTYSLEDASILLETMQLPGDVRFALLAVFSLKAVQITGIGESTVEISDSWSLG